MAAENRHYFSTVEEIHKLKKSKTMMGPLIGLGVFLILMETVSNSLSRWNLTPTAGIMAIGFGIMALVLNRKKVNLLTGNFIDFQPDRLLFNSRGSHVEILNNRIKSIEIKVKEVLIVRDDDTVYVFHILDYNDFKVRTEIKELFQKLAAPSDQDSLD